jgi:hypothetical protein
MKLQIKNVQLISKKNPAYKSYCEQFKSTNNNIVQSGYVKTKAFTASHILEIAVREWIKKSGQLLKNRIISYEVCKGNKYERRFKELDYVLKKNNRLIVGELKVSNKNPISTAVEQLVFSQRLLRHINKSVQTQIIWIDLGAKFSKDIIDEFTPKFLEAKFRTIDRSGEQYKFNHKFQYLQLGPEEIYKWGLDNKILHTPQLLDAILEEAEIINKERNIRLRLHNIDRFYETYTEEEKTSADNEKYALQKQSVHVGIAKQLHQKGYAIRTNSNACETEEVINSLSDSFVIKQSTNIKSDFGTDNCDAKYLVFKKQHFSNKEIVLLDAEKVYHRFSVEDKTKLENSFIHFGTRTVPIVDNSGRRKFVFDYNKISDEQKSSSIIASFMQILHNAIPAKINMNETDILIIDNHRMLHKIV